MKNLDLISAVEDVTTKKYVDDADALKAPIASPTFTGVPAAPTATAGTNTTQLATTAFVTAADNLKANLASPTFTGTPAAPTAAPGTNTTQLATTAFVTAADALAVKKAGDTMTGPLLLNANPTQPLGAMTKRLHDNTSRAYAVTATAFNSATLPGVWPELLLGTNTNGPGDGYYYYVVNYLYAGSANDDLTTAHTQNMTQVIYSYNGTGQWMRNRYGGTWSGWTRFATLGDLNSYLPLTGGTLTSDLGITTAAGSYAGLIIKTSNVNRWYISKYNTAETGANAGSDFGIYRYSDAGAFLGDSLRISRATGLITVEGDPVSNLGVATKQYVDNKSGLYLPLSGGTISGSLVVTGNETVYGTSNAGIQKSRTFQLDPNGEPSYNLGNPTLPEMALFQTQFNNKTRFYDPTKITCEKTTDGTNWVAVTVSDSDKRRMMAGTGALFNGGVTIPRDSVKFRINIANDGAYVYLNALYMYTSYNPHSSKIHIWAKNAGTQVWTQITASAAVAAGWPSHTYLPHTTLPFINNGTSGYYDAYRIEFTPTWATSGGYENMGISINTLELWGGYPAAKRDLYGWDEYGTSYFQSAKGYDAGAVALMRGSASATGPIAWIMDEGYGELARIDSKGRYQYGTTNPLIVGDGGATYGSSYRGLSVGTGGSALLLGVPADPTTYLMSSGAGVHLRPSGDPTKEFRVTNAATVASTPLSVAASMPSITLNETGGTTQADLIFAKNGTRRIVMRLQDAETGGNAGSNLAIFTASDAGAGLVDALKITRSTGLATVAGDPTVPTGIATKQYVDARVGANEVYVGPTQPTDPAIDHWIDPTGTAGGSPVQYLPLTGGTVSGNVTIQGDTNAAWLRASLGADMAGQKITNVATPTASTDAANMGWVQGRNPPIIVLGPSDPVPGSTATGTIIIRTT